LGAPDEGEVEAAGSLERYRGRWRRSTGGNDDA
jgi:hypothetical protein